MAVTLKYVPSVRFADWDNGMLHWSLPKRAGGPKGNAVGLISPSDYDSSHPIRLTHGFLDEGWDFWLYQKKFYVTTDVELTPNDVIALLNESANRRRLQLEKAHALQAMTEELSKGPKRAHIRQDIKILVWQRDQGRCVSCSSQTDLEFDHIIPIAMGGANTARNLQLLCEPCNRRKGATLG